MYCKFCRAEMPKDSDKCFFCGTIKGDVDRVKKHKICNCETCRKNAIARMQEIQSVNQLTSNWLMNIEKESQAQLAKEQVR